MAGNSTVHKIQELLASQPDLGFALDLHQNQLGPGALTQVMLLHPYSFTFSCLELQILPTTEISSLVNRKRNVESTYKHAWLHAPMCLTSTDARGSSCLGLEAYNASSEHVACSPILRAEGDQENEHYGKGRASKAFDSRSAVPKRGTISASHLKRVTKSLHKNTDSEVPRDEGHKLLNAT